MMIRGVFGIQKMVVTCKEPGKELQLKPLLFIFRICDALYKSVWKLELHILIEDNGLPSFDVDTIEADIAMLIRRKRLKDKSLPLKYFDGKVEHISVGQSILIAYKNDYAFITCKTNNSSFAKHAAATAYLFYIF